VPKLLAAQDRSIKRCVHVTFEHYLFACIIQATDPIIRKRFVFETVEGVVGGIAPLSYGVNGERKHRRYFPCGHRRREALTRILRDRSLSSILQDASRRPAHTTLPSVPVTGGGSRAQHGSSTWTLVPHTLRSGSEYMV